MKGEDFLLLQHMDHIPAKSKHLKFSLFATHQITEKKSSSARSIESIWRTGQYQKFWWYWFHVNTFGVYISKIWQSFCFLLSWDCCVERPRSNRLCASWLRAPCYVVLQGFSFTFTTVALSRKGLLTHQKKHDAESHKNIPD